MAAAKRKKAAADIPRGASEHLLSDGVRASGEVRDEPLQHADRRADTNTKPRAARP
jgi:hypothetical protein